MAKPSTDEWDFAILNKEEFEESENKKEEKDSGVDMDDVELQVTTPAKSATKRKVPDAPRKKKKNQEGKDSSQRKRLASARRELWKPVQPPGKRTKFENPEFHAREDIRRHHDTSIDFGDNDFYKDARPIRDDTGPSLVVIGFMFLVVLTVIALAMYSSNTSHKDYQARELMFAKKYGKIKDVHVNSTSGVNGVKLPPCPVFPVPGVPIPLQCRTSLAANKDHSRLTRRHLIKLRGE